MDRLFSLQEPAPAGFATVKEYSRRLFRRRAFVLWAEDLELARRFLGEDLPHLSGLLLHPGSGAFRVEQVAPSLFAAGLGDDHALLEARGAPLEVVLALLDRLHAAEDHGLSVELELERCAASRDRTASDFESLRLSLLRELDQRVLLEARARDGEHKARALLDRTFGLVGLLSPAGVLLDANQTALSFARCTLDEVRGKPFWETPWVSGSPEMQENARSAVAAAESQGALANFELVLPDAQGARHTFDFYLRPFRDEAGQVVCLIVEAWDITSRKQAEEEKAKLQSQLVQSQKMESVGRLAGGVAHDFNNMLGVIIGRAEMALLAVPTDSPALQDLREILKTAERSAQLTRQLLVFARKETIRPEVLDLDQAVGGMVGMLRRLVGENIRLDFQPGAGVWPVLADPAQLDQVVTNLTVNARDAIAGTGTIAFSTGNRTLASATLTPSGTAPAGEYARLTVRDSGGGMEPEVMEHLFEPFYTTKAVGKGTGLGLATVLGVVQQHHGFIEVSSEAGLGSEFSVYFPRARVAAPATARAAPRPQGGSETLLVVEDEPAVLAMDEKLLRNLGYTVLSAASPAEALHLMESRSPAIDLLVTDVIMPGMNGRELSEALRRRLPGLKVLFMSGYAADVVSGEGVLEEGLSFLQKPFTLAGMAAAIRKALGS